MQFDFKKNIIVKRLIFLLFHFLSLQALLAQPIDSLEQARKNIQFADTTLLSNLSQSNINMGRPYESPLQKILSENKYLNSSRPAESLTIIKRAYKSMDVLFYSIFLLFLFFGFLKMAYSRYLNTLLRVFFNTSLRQSQLTDQLLQAKLPSLFFNLFFILAGGFYIYLLLSYFGYIDRGSDFKLLGICITALFAVYAIKYIVLKFTGWISGYSNAADNYIFIVFLINKMIAIALIPIIIIMAFSDHYLVNAVILLSYFVIILMFLLRFFRSYSILQNKVNVKRFHFFLYIMGIEILPLLLIYKSAVNLLTNYL